jgi:hypothetical protein
MMMRTPLTISVALATLSLIASAVAAQRTHYFDPAPGSVYPAVDYDLDCDRDTTDLDDMETSLCGSDPLEWLYDFDLDGVCEYDENEDDWVLVNLGRDGAPPSYTFYWCVSDQFDGGQTGEWNYQMDNTYAQDDTTHGQTEVPAEVNRSVAIFYANHFGFWPTFKVDSGDRVGGLHCLLLPTPDSTYDDGQYQGTWEYRIRQRFGGNGLDPDTDAATGDWLACWNHYMDLHYDRIHGLSLGAGAINELCGTGGVSGSFAGYGVIDYEHMQLTWDFESSDGTIANPSVPDQWRDVVEDINSPIVDTDFIDFMDGTQWEFTPNYGGGIPGAWNSLGNKEELYESSFNCFMYYLIKETLDACRDVSSGSAKFGFWGLPKRTVTLDDTMDADRAAYHDELEWLWDDDLDDDVYVDMLLLSLYARHTTTVGGVGDCDACDDNPGNTGTCPNCSRPTEDYTDSAKFYRANVAEMLYLRDAYNSSLLVLPFVWREYGNQARCQFSDVNDFVSYQQFLLPKFYGADGVMIWDDIDRSNLNSGSDADRLRDLVDDAGSGGLWYNIIIDHSCP